MNVGSIARHRWLAGPGKRISRLAFPMFGGALLLCFAGCSHDPGVNADAVVDERLAEVNGRPISRSDFEAYVRFGGTELESLTEPDLLKDFLTQQVLLQAAQDAGVTLSEEELGQASRDWFPVGSDLTEEDLGPARTFLTIQKFITNKCAAENEIELREMRAYYADHYEEFQIDEQVRVLEILVEDLGEAERLREELEPHNFRNFRQKAKALSIGNTAESEGELGVFTPGDLPERFESTIFALKVGEISQVFQSEHGFHLFMVEESIPRHDQKFHEVQQEIFRRLMAERERETLAAFLPQLLEAAEISLFEQGRKREWSFENGR